MSVNPYEIRQPSSARLRRKTNDPGMAKLSDADSKTARLEKIAAERVAYDRAAQDAREKAALEKSVQEKAVLEKEVARLKELLAKRTRTLRDVIYRLEAEGEVRWCEDCDTVHPLGVDCKCEEEDSPGLSISERNR